MKPGERARRGAPWRRLVSVLSLTMLLAVAVPASADMAESQQGKLLVLQTISLIANNAPPPLILQRLADAQNAPDQTGVDRVKIAQAAALLKGSDGRFREGALAQARQLLVGAIAVRAATGYGQIPGPGQVGQGAPPYATGADSGTTVVLDELTPARGVHGGGDLTLLLGGVLMVGVGLYLSRRWRPTDSLRQLRQLSAAAADARETT
jgi:hypothetical protein